MVCALAVTLDSFWPTMALLRLLLPALGRPMMATKPAAISITCQSGNCRDTDSHAIMAMLLTSHVSLRATETLLAMQYRLGGS